MRYALVLVAAVVAIGAMSVSVTAQVLRGTVVDDDSGAPVSIAHIALLVYGTDRTLVETEADSLGRFRLMSRGAGTFSLQVSRIGYQQLRIDSLEIGEDREVVVELRMGLNAVPADPITVLGNNRFDHARLEEYYDRLERMSRAGIGRFVTREQIEAHPATNATDLLQGVPALSIQGGRERVILMRNSSGDCIPQVYVDGMLANRDGSESLDEFISADTVEGIEIYRGFTEAPGRYYDPNGCGVILVWSRRTTDDGRPLTWRRVLIAGTIIGLVLLLVN